MEVLLYITILAIGRSIVTIATEIDYSITRLTSGSFPDTPERNSNITVETGDLFVMYCDIPKLNNSDFELKHMNQTIYKIIGDRGLYEIQYDIKSKVIRRTDNSTTYKFIVRDVTVAHAGVWRCVMIEPELVTNMVTVAVIKRSILTCNDIYIMCTATLSNSVTLQIPDVKTIMDRFNATLYLNSISNSVAADMHGKQAMCTVCYSEYNVTNICIMKHMYGLVDPKFMMISSTEGYLTADGNPRMLHRWTRGKNGGWTPHFGKIYTTETSEYKITNFIGSPLYVNVVNFNVYVVNKILQRTAIGISVSLCIVMLIVTRKIFVKVGAYEHVTNSDTAV